MPRLESVLSTAATALAALLTLLVVTVPVVQAASDVIDLTDKTYPDFIKAEKLTLVQYFAPWCGHCKALKPEFEKAAEQLKPLDVKIAKVNCEENTKLCEKEDVRGYPTLKVFNEGVASDYRAARTADAIVSYMQKLTLPAVSLLQDKSEIEEFAAKERVVVVAFVEKEGDATFEAVEKVANQMRDSFVFAATANAEAAAGFNAAVPSVLLIKQFDEGMARYDGPITAERVADFVKENSVPLVDDIGPENYAMYAESGLPLGYYFWADEDDKKAAAELLKPIAQKHRSKLYIVLIDANKFGGHARNLNIKEEWPAFGIHDAGTNLKYPFEGAFEAGPLGDFVDGVVSGSIKPSVKSEPVPEHNDGPVTVVVGDTYEKIVMDTEKDVFIEFYANWCGYCKKLAPIWEELGEAYAAVPNVVIAKFLATDNDLPPSAAFRVEGFPTLKLIKAGSNEVVDYNGDRTVEAMIEFLEANAVNKGHVEVPASADGAADEDDDEEDGGADEQDEL